MRGTVQRLAMSESHAGHHTHLETTMLRCSCGVIFGTIAAAIPENYDPSDLVCSVCGETGIALFPPEPDNRASRSEETE